MYDWERTPYGGGYVAGFDLPPWYTVIPGLTPLGMAEWGGKQAGQQLRSRGILAPSASSSSPPFEWSSVMKVGAVVGIGVVGYFLYRSIRGGARTASSAIRGGMAGASE